MFLEVNAQEEVHYPYEVGINVTSVLSTFLGNSNALDASDFPLQIRLGKKPTKMRIGLGAESSRKTIFDQVTGSNRRSKQIGIASRIGFEKNTSLGNRFGFYWGADAIILLSNNAVQTFSSGSPTLKEESFGIGGGPIVGLKFNLSKRVYFSTEATMYSAFRSQKRTGSSNIPTTDTFFDFMISPPLFLYLNISLGK